MDPSFKNNFKLNKILKAGARTKILIIRIRKLKKVVKLCFLTYAFFR